MKCPNCGVEGAAGAAECSACGVIFAKFKRKLERPPVPTVYNPWKGRAIAAALALLWAAGFGLYYRGKVAAMRVRNPAGPARTR
jgi:hypothetical protein